VGVFFLNTVYNQSYEDNMQMCTLSRQGLEIFQLFKRYIADCREEIV